MTRRNIYAKYLDSVAWTCDKYLFLYRLRHISSTGRERFTWHLKSPVGKTLTNQGGLK